MAASEIQTAQDSKPIDILKVSRADVICGMAASTSLRSERAIQRLLPLGALACYIAVSSLRSNPLEGQRAVALFGRRPTVNDVEFITGTEYDCPLRHLLGA